MKPAHFASIILLALLAPIAPAATVSLVDFRDGPGGWQHVTANGAISSVEFTDDGMELVIVGEDPYIWGPLEDYPPGEPVRLTFRMKSTADAAGQVFWGTPAFTAGQSVPFTAIPDGKWRTYTVDLPPLAPSARVRIDPSQGAGLISILWARTEAASAIETFADFDFTTGANGWSAGNQVTNFQATPEGITFTTTGGDPWINGPEVDFPGGESRFLLRMRSTAPGSGRLFWATDGAFNEGEAQSLALVPDGQWRDYEMILPAIDGPNRLRLDPATGAGSVTIERIALETVIPVDGPVLVPPPPPAATAQAPLEIRNGLLKLVHLGETFGNLEVRVGLGPGVLMAAGHVSDRVGIVEPNGFVRWVELDVLPATVTAIPGGVRESVSWSVTPGEAWTLSRTFTAGAIPGVLDVEATLECTAPATVAHVPWLTLFPGLASFGASKDQGLLAGLEYLADEPSSNQLDITSPDYLRLVPHPRKLTFPLAAIAKDGRWLGLQWEKSDLAALVHDSPDRVFGGDAHLWALWGPNVGVHRRENEVWSSSGFALSPGEPATFSGQVTGGLGDSTVPAVQAHAALRGFPPQPEFPGGLPAAADILARGWTRSDLYDGAGRWRHAVWFDNFGFTPAADATSFLHWLRRHVQDPTLQAEVEAAFDAGLAVARAQSTLLAGGVSHVIWPTSPFVFGDATAYMNARRSGATSQLALFDAQGIRPWTPPAEGIDYGSTHFANDANGYSAATVAGILEAAQLSGNPTLISQAVALLDKQTVLYAGSVPRGAQTWEIPLHTPDILASAYMMKAYVIGFELTGRQDLLDEAVYWAWTGVPFLYLDPWEDGPTGDYATIPVLGATAFVGSWFARPVQWCGLVYRSWLLRLAKHDDTAPWKQVADGITASGLQQTWPASDAERQGLLPDFFFLETQLRDGPAINPGTVLANMPEAFGAGAFFDVHVHPQAGWIIQAPSEIRVNRVEPTGIDFTVDGWGTEPYEIVVTRMPFAPVTVLAADPADPSSFASVTRAHDLLDGRLVLKDLVGDKRILLGMSPPGPGNNWRLVE